MKNLREVIAVFLQRNLGQELCQEEQGIPVMFYIGNQCDLLDFLSKQREEKY